MAASREPEDVIIARNGSVLGKKTILKSDHFPGCQNKRLLPHVEGAPNYRQVENKPVYGVAIPTVDGIRRVLELIGASKYGCQRVLWHNLREEPVVYVNGRPFVLREVERPFTNLEYTGINRQRVEQMEARLKEDVLQEATKFANKIMVSDELPDGQMIDQWEPVGPNSIQTPFEVYESLQAEGYCVDYERIPITDEKSPKERDFDSLVQRLSQVELGTKLVFNCQMGRGRTTTGMVIATLIHLRRVGASGLPRSSSMGMIHEARDEMLYDVPDTEEALRRGEYTVIRSLVRVLEGGVEGKRQVDKVIDSCSAMQNLREAIAGYRNSIQRQADEKKREAALSFFVEYLERYYFLICFAVYIHSDKSSTNRSGQGGFEEWMRARPELYSILRRLLRRDPMGALGYSNKPMGVIKRSSKAADGRPSRMENIVATRNGEVLGRQTVLKSDHCPGCQSQYLPELIEGAPNFREVAPFPVYGVANPTVEGIRAVLQRVAEGNSERPVLWHNMREEPVVYINGKPFVLREVERPYKNMLEYEGIDRARVEKMEARLKEDILREAERYSGDIMVNHETDDGQIYDAWENVGPGSVQTPLEVYECLKAEGYLVDYARVPITDGKAPKSSDFGALASRIATASRDTAFVFNCQMGRGRTTTGMVIACLVLLRCENGPLRALDLPSQRAEPENGSSSGEEVNNSDMVVGSPANRIEEKSSIAGFVMDDIPIVRKITRLLDNGAECREALDGVIDHCASMQNLRQAVLHYRRAFNDQKLEHYARRAALNRGIEYLERYLMLIGFAAFLNSESFNGYIQGGSGASFKSWLHRHPEVRQMKWSMRLRPTRVFTINEMEFKAHGENDQEDSVMEAVVKSRTGSILGKHSILKMYFFPGQKTTSDHVPIVGAPHVCKVEGFPVHSMATPTIDGAKAVLSHLFATPACQMQRKAVVTDLREEVVVYVHGNPFVLREVDQPVSTLKHVGVKGHVVEQMESRLKDDILAEAERTGGRMLLHKEEYNPITGHSEIIGYWEVISPEDVQTPAEVYAGLRTEGYNLDYQRIPLTRERAALTADVDAIHRRLDEAGSDVEYIFISHTGFGGIAYAMAMTCLRLQAEQQLASLSVSSSKGTDNSSHQFLANNRMVHRPANDMEAFRQGDYRDILSLTRVLASGPASKAEVDVVIDRCSGAGHLRDDIYDYKLEFDRLTNVEDERRDMGINALRRYFFLIAFRSYLFSRVTFQENACAGDMSFSTWMKARPELGHLCDNLKLK
jgi:protein-tyrosine phosphatase